MIPALVDIDKAMRHCEVTDTERMDDIEDRVLQASDIVMDYIKLDEPPDDWYDDSSPAVLNAVPYLIQAAVLVVAGELFMNREASVVDVLSPSVKSMLHRYRDPALA